MTKPRLNFTSSWDDGDALDAKLAQLLHKHSLPATFYLTSHCAMYERIGDLLDLGFEVGGHTMTHPMDMKLLDNDALEWEIGSNKKLLELQGAKVTKFCYPRGRFDDRVIEVLKKHKLKEARTTKVLIVDKPTDPYRTDTTIHVYPRAEYGGIDWMIAAQRLAKEASDRNGIFHIWGHSHEIEKLKEWDKLEKFFIWLNENYQIWKV